jgi:hypothetical protein
MMHDFEVAGLTEAIGPEHFFPTVRLAVEAFRQPTQRDVSEQANERCVDRQSHSEGDEQQRPPVHVTRLYASPFGAKVTHGSEERWKFPPFVAVPPAQVVKCG